MTDTDVVVIGAGLAGSTTAAMLGRAGIPTTLIDPHPVYPPDLRCEKLDRGQVAILHKTGLDGIALSATTFDGTTRDGKAWIARFGRVIDKRPGGQYGILYDDLVNVMRSAVPPDVSNVVAKAVRITTGDDRQEISLSDGSVITARLVVLAHGLSVALKDQLGIERTITSPCHSITLAFDIKPHPAKPFEFAALTYYPERARDRMAYLTLFPIGTSMRANLMVYRTMDDPWLREMRHDPARGMFALMPNLRRLIGDVEVVGPVKIRPADLYVSQGHRQAGIVLIGDAYASSCPAAGTGAGKVFTDVERLCNVHIPNWLASPGMAADKINQFYDDPVKRAYDETSTSWAYRLRSMSIEEGISWSIQRRLRFFIGAAISAACKIGVISDGKQFVPEGWTQRLRDRT